MIVDRYIDLIQPNVVVWQLCTNDFIDNHLNLEAACKYSVDTRRPYFNTSGAMYYGVPLSLLKKIKPYSTLIYFLGSRFQNICKQFNWTASGERKIAEQGRAYALYDSAVAITSLHLARMKQRIPPNTKLLVFVSDHFQPQYNHLAQLCQQAGLTFLDSIAARVVHQERQGQTVRTNDGYHWNEAGHRIVAEALYAPVKAAIEN